ncbi:Fc.00g040680.m01.CDS01 [Cosmosporella sp. VM-42]
MGPEVEALQHENSSDSTMGQEESKFQELSSEKAALETKLADEIHLRRFTEVVLDSRQQELESQETEKDHLSKKMDALKKELADTQRQLAEARIQNKTKTKQLQDAKDQIFRLQPRRKDITESEAQDAYKTLCGNVQRWVENRLKGILDDLDSGRLRTRPIPPQATRFITLIRESAKRYLGVDQSDEHHVMAAIMNYLWLVLFSKSFYCALDDGDGDRTLTWINELESTMSQQPRDVAHCREWRSETLTALTSQPAFKSRRIRYIQLVTEDLTSLLAIFAPKAPPGELAGSIRRSIVEPAIDLVHQLHLASNIFSLKWPARNASARLEVYECINLASGGMVLDLRGTTQNSPARRNVSYLFDVAPGLFVERIENGKKLGLKSIAKPTVLVHSGDGGVPQNQTIVKWLWDSTGGPRPTARAAAPKSKPGYPTRISKL